MVNGKAGKYSVISPQERLPDQLILPKDGQDLGTENCQVSLSLSSDLPGQRRGIFAMQKVLWQERVCADGLSSPSSASGVALVWRMCHWHSSGLYMPKNATLTHDVGIVGKGAPVAGPASWCLEEAQLSGVNSKVQMLHRWVGNSNVSSQPS